MSFLGNLMTYNSQHADHMLQQLAAMAQAYAPAVTPRPQEAVLVLGFDMGELEQSRPIE